MSWWTRKGWRWGAVAGAICVLAILPAAVGRIPAVLNAAEPRVLIELIAGSDGVAYQGVVETTARLGLPDVERAQQLAQLLGEKHRLRVWYAKPSLWRVDELTPIGEHDTYMDSTGIWVWDSGRRSATRVKGIPAVRFLRAADLLPPEIGRRVASAASPTDVEAIDPRRVAGIEAAGLRVAPSSSTSTVGYVDMWVEPTTGLPLRVEIVPRGAEEPLITTAFLEFDASRPDPDLLRFEPPRDATFNFSVAPDFAQAVGRYSPFLLPETIAGIDRRTEIASAAATYGRGFELVAVLALSERYSPFRASELERLQTISGPWGTGRVVETPLFNALTFEQNGIVFILGGTVTTEEIEAVAQSLVEQGVRYSE